MRESGAELKLSAIARERSRGAMGDRTFARERLRRATRERTFAREHSRRAMGERMFAKGDLQGHCTFQEKWKYNWGEPERAPH